MRFETALRASSARTGGMMGAAKHWLAIREKPTVRTEEARSAVSKSVHGVFL